MAFDSLSDKLQNIFKHLKGKGKLSEADVKAALKEVKMALLEADVNFKVVKKFVADVQERAVGVLESDGMKAIREDRFDTVITNPPIRAGKQKVYELLKEAQEALDTEGKLYLVIRKQQGAESCIRYLKSLFRQVDKIGRSGGFWILCAGEKLKEGASQDESGTDVL